MLYLEQITYKNFISGGYPITFQPNGMKITAYTIGRAFAKVDVKTRDGVYAIKFGIRSIYPTFLKIGQQVINLKSDINTITFKAQESTTTFEIASNQIPKNRHFFVIGLSITVKCEDKVIKSPVEFIPPKKITGQPIETIQQKNTCQTVKVIKKKALLYIDEYNWCFHRIAKKIIEYYGNDIDFTIMTQGEKGDGYDYVIKLWYGSTPYPDIFDLNPNAIKMVCFYDSYNWRKEPFYSQAMKDIKQADYVGYSCEQIKNELDCDNKICITDGVDTKLFTEQPFTITDKLKVGWVGNSKCPVKNYDKLSEKLESLDWIEFIPHLSNNVSHDQMPNYYKSIDILVCFSSSEGTPNPILEASACGRTWIATNVGIVSEMLKYDPDCGFIIKNLTQLCNRLKFLRNNIVKLMDMGKKAKNVVKTHFDWSQRITSFGNVFGIKLPNQQKVVVSTQFTRYGGAATCAYELHRYLLANDSMSICIFFDSSKATKDKYNPDNLPNVYYHSMPKNVNDVADHEYNLDNLSIGNADVYAFNYLAPVIAKHIFPKATVHYMITGCPYINNKNLLTSTNLLQKQIPLLWPKDPEATTVRVVDKIIPNTWLSKNIFEHIYRRRIEDPIDLHEIFNVNIPSDDRSIDILFVCSDITRKVKGIDFVVDIFSNKLMSKYRKVIVGKNKEKVVGLMNTELPGLVSKEDVMKLMSQSKIVIIPSYIESYSITAIEAVQAGCIVLTSHNTACASFFPSFFVVNDYDTTNWVHKLKYILNNYSYFSQIFTSSHQKTTGINNLLVPERSAKKINVILFTIDLPYVGGCGTNSYNIITELQKDIRYNAACIFITNIKGDHNPDNLSNIYRVEYDNKTYQTLTRLKKQLPNPDVIFCKNYKAMIFAKAVYPQTKIIYSPSGLRKISSIVKSVPVSQLDIKPITKPINLKVYPISDVLEFIKTNDEELDDYAIRQADVVVPNSTLTHSLIDRTWEFIPNLAPPMYVTNISFDNIDTSDFDSRKYDIAFIAYDWKRSCKNITLTENIIASPAMRQRNIVVVGKSQKNPPTDTVTRFENLSKEKIFELLKETKVLVVPSNMDSNPNVIIEAIQCGCNVVTSTNVGSYQNLPTQCVIKGTSLSEWIESINTSLVERFQYYGPTKYDILEQLRTVTQVKKAVGIYKIPPLFDRLLPKNKLNNIQFFLGPNGDEYVRDVVNNDIFYQLFVGIALRNKCDIIDYVLFDESIETNQFYPVHKYLPYVKKGITIWKIKDMNSMTKFANGDVYFLRGTYYQFYKDIVPPYSKTYYYPATSFKQGNELSLSLLTDKRFTVLFEHSDSLYHRRYLADKVVIFDKFAPDSFVCYNRRRTVHMCYVATDGQPTKNHHLFVHFVNWLNKQTNKYTVAYVGDIDKLQENCKTRFDTLRNVTLINHPKLTHDELINLYNETKVNVIFSGRDACPRVVSESGACGCYNVSLDTVSDGKGYYDGVLGELVGDTSVPKKLISGSYSYDPSPILWTKIQKALSRRYDYNMISQRSRRKYNLEQTLSRTFDE